MYCLDTNIIIEFLKGNKIIIEKVNIARQQGEIFITYISLCELYKGIYLSNKIETELEELDEFLEAISVVGLDKESCESFGKDFVKLQKSGKMTNEFDLMIASIVKANNLILITRDKKHFDNLGVKVNGW